MGGGAANQGQTGADPRPGPAVFGHPRGSPPPRLLLREMASLPIPDELLAEIFLRLPTPTDLIRASVACVSFRLVAAYRSFLRRFRKLHAPPLLGFLERERKVFHPAAPPHPSAPEASAIALAADFSFSFLPARASDWAVRDIRDGRVLLDRPHEHDIENGYKVVFPELVVCDPLHRRYLLLPPIPAHLTAMVKRPLRINPHRYCETFLAPPGSDGDEESSVEETSFSVVWMAQCRTKLAAFVFSSRTAQWRAISSQSWSDLLAGRLSSTGLVVFSWRQYAYGCFYWVTNLGKRLLVLDTRRMEFSVAKNPPETRGLPFQSVAIVEAGEGRLGMFVRPRNANYLNYNIRRNICGSSSQQWQFEKTIALDSGYLLVCSTGRHLFLYQCGSPPLDAAYFSLDVKTFHLERVFVSNSCIPNMFAYSNFPPSLLSTPTVSCGVEMRRRWNKAALQAQAHGHHGQTTADANAGGQADALLIRDGDEAATQLDH